VPTAREGGTAATLRAPPADADPQADPARLGQPDLAGRTDGRDGPGQGAAQGAAQGAGQGNAQGAVQGTARDAGRDPLADARTAADRADAERQERQALERAALAIQDAVRADPALAAIAQQLQVDITPEGLRIQIVDADRQPMFATGSSALNDRARALLAKVAPVLLRLPEGVSIAGHTDAQPYRGAERSNWDLSAERANATRRLLTDAGLPEARIRAVAGHADREPLVAADRMAAANRRVAILVLRDLPLRDAQPGAAPRGAPAPDALTPGVPARTQSSR